MLQPERDISSTPVERVTPSFDTEKRQRDLAGHAIATFTFLGEVDTAYDYERGFLRAHVIGQDPAIEAIVTALDQKDVRADDDNHPVATFAFLGPTGVGKTEMAKGLSKALNIDEPNLVRIDCSNFSNGHEVSMLTGAPPSYVGREQVALLAADRIERPGTVLLFDEIEKGSDKLFNLLLQIMDDGILTLNDGSTTSFRDTVVILTSNLGASEMAKQNGRRTGFGVETKVADQATTEAIGLRSFKEFFTPEFFNRLDKAVVFHPLGEDSMRRILDVKLDALNQVYRDTHGAVINLSDKTKEHLVEVALQEPEYGARPLVRELKESVTASFGRYTKHDRIPEGSQVHVYHRDEVGEHIDDSHTSDLVFAISPDDTIKKRVTVVPDVHEVVFKEPGDPSPSKELVPIDPEA